MSHGPKLGTKNIPTIPNNFPHEKQTTFTYFFFYSARSINFNLTINFSSPLTWVLRHKRLNFQLLQVANGLKIHNLFEIWKSAFDLPVSMQISVQHCSINRVKIELFIFDRALEILHSI